MSNEIRAQLKNLVKSKDYAGLKAFLAEMPVDTEIPLDSSSGKTILFSANHDQKIFQLLLHCPKIDKAAIDNKNGTTALFHNLKNISEEDFIYYLNIVSHEDIRFRFGNIPDLLFACANERRWKLIGILLERKFPIRKYAIDDTILSVCSRNKQYELVEKILKIEKMPFIEHNFNNKVLVNYQPLNSHLAVAFKMAVTLSDFTKILFHDTLAGKSKLLYKYVFNYAKNEINYTNLTMLDLCFFLKLDINFAVNFVETNLGNPINLCLSTNDKKVFKEIFDVLSKQYSLERIQKLFRSIPACFASDISIETHDILRMLRSLEEHNIEFPKKPKSFVDLRKMLIRAVRKIDQNDYDLIPQLGIKVLEQIKLGPEQLTTYVPVKNFELIDTSHFINICVGNGEYAEKIMAKDSLIILIKRQEELLYCVELNFHSFFEIIQAKGEGNILMPEELLYELNDKIQEIMNRYVD